METITVTFGDVAENHVGMQKIGKMSDNGFSYDDLKKMHDSFIEKTELINLSTINDAPPAFILIIRNGVDCLLHPHKADDLFKEQLSLEWDKKAKMRGKVVNKRARYNVCYAEHAQEPSYEEGKGRIVAFKGVPILNVLRNKLTGIIGEKLNAEGNFYYDINKCGIGFHGDSERKKVIAVRLGASMPLYYQWYQNSSPVGERIELMFHHGDIYMMSEKATGNDWKKRKILTLRHGTK